MNAPSYPSPEEDPRPTRASGAEARQGAVGHNVRLVLWVALIGAVIALGIAYLLVR